jgi:hypothetical protein
MASEKGLCALRWRHLAAFLDMSIAGSRDACATRLGGAYIGTSLATHDMGGPRRLRWFRGILPPKTPDFILRGVVWQEPLLLLLAHANGFCKEVSCSDRR